MIIKLFMASFLIITSTFGIAGLAAAQTSTPSATASSAAEVNKSLQERIKRTVGENGDVQGVNDGQEVKGFIGSVKRVSEDAINLDTTRGTLILSLTDDIVFVKGNAAVKPSDIEIDNEVIVMGYQTAEAFQAKRVVVATTALRPPARQILVGNVQEITTEAVTILARGQQTPTVYSLNRQTDILDALNEEVTVRDIEIGDDVILITLPENETTRKVRESVGQVKTLRSLSTETQDQDDADQ